MRYLILAIVITLSACTHPAVKEIQTWSAQQKLLAESGQIKWSDYYKEMFKKFSDAPNFGGKGEAMELSNQLITASLAYEDGKLSKEEFDAIRRGALAAAQKYYDEEASSASRAARGQAVQNAGGQQRRCQTICTVIKNGVCQGSYQTTCN